MNGKHRQQYLQEDGLASNCAVVGANVLHPGIVEPVITDPAILDQGRLYAEALKQTRPIVEPGTATGSITKIIRDGTARPNGLTQVTAERMATSGRSLDSFIKGANPIGKAAEVVVASDYSALHAGQNPGIINGPPNVAQNVQDIRLAPDTASRKDLVFAFETNNSQVIWKYNGQVKTGGPQYVADTLVEMAKTPGYGKVGYVDARYVNGDGTPRVAEDAFTEGQARRLQEANVRLRGIPDLEQRAEQLMDDIKAGKLDGLDPITREELKQLSDDIAAAYRARNVVGRIAGGAAIAAATAAIVSLIVQFATEGKVDAKTVCKSAGTGAIYGAGGAAADAGLYHLGIHFLDMAPEVAKEFAKQGVSIGFCMLAIGTDFVSELRAAHRGEVTTSEAIAGTAVKTALDLLPLVLASLGLAGLPVLVGAQVGGRWLISKAREADRVLGQASSTDAVLAQNITQRMATFNEVVESLQADCAETDHLFSEVMGHALHSPPQFCEGLSLTQENMI